MSQHESIHRTHEVPPAQGPRTTNREVSGPPFIPYPPIAAHGVVGDRRTAALVAADGTVDWFCLPDFDSASLFDALLDAERGGYWRFGPAQPILGRQRIHDHGAILHTAWQADGADLELSDAMIWPETNRPSYENDHRVLIRRLRCHAGQGQVQLGLRPRRNFESGPTPEAIAEGVRWSFGEKDIGLWANFALEVAGDSIQAELAMAAGDELWAVLSLGEEPAAWSVARARSAMAANAAYWRNWQNGLSYNGPRGNRVRRSALAVHLLSFAPTGSLVAAPTTSLPERIGGSRNYDYRFAWIRDASLSLAVLSLLGATQTAGEYMDWLSKLDSSTDAPLQVLYGIRGEVDAREHRREDLAGYRESLPVRYGNGAYRQRQLDSLGFLADCAWIYLQNNGRWRSEYWDMIYRVASYTAANWEKPDSGIWELSTEAHYVSSKVMSWVTLERSVRIAKKLGHKSPVVGWQRTMEAIKSDVMDRGWSDSLGAFRQRYDADTLDAATLLISVMEFLPPDHPRVLATIERMQETLTIDGFVHRFVPADLPGLENLPVGEFEGAFLPCTFWLATSLAKAGRTDEAEGILRRVEAIAGEVGFFAEEVDARERTFLGNTPLLFSQVEYVRAILELARARPLDRVLLMSGMVGRRLKSMLPIRT